jgi:hypothetical protein
MTCNRAAQGPERSADEAWSNDCLAATAAENCADDTQKPGDAASHQKLKKAHLKTIRHGLAGAR